MNTRERIENMLIENGMFKQQAVKVMEKAIPKLNSIVENYDITWNGSASEYPDVIYNILYNAVKPIALKWINDNIPMAWYKPMFETITKK